MKVYVLFAKTIRELEDFVLVMRKLFPLVLCLQAGLRGACVYVYQGCTAVWLIEQSLISPKIGSSSLEHSITFGHAFSNTGHASMCTFLFGRFELLLLMKNHKTMMDTLLTPPLPEFRISIKCCQAANFLLIKYDHLGVIGVKKVFIMGCHSFWK